MLEQPFHSRCADAGLHRARAAGVVLLLPLLRERARVDGEPGVVLQVRVGAAQPRRQASAGVRGVLPRADGLERVGARREARREEQRVAVCAAPPRRRTARVRARHRIAGAPAQAPGVGVAAGLCSVRRAGRPSSRGLGWRIHESVEDTELSTNKQHTLSLATKHNERVCPSRDMTDAEKTRISVRRARKCPNSCSRIPRSPV